MNLLRLHREALKQSATDPKTGIIDVSILTTGVSSSERMRRQLLAKEIKKMLAAHSKSGTQHKHNSVLEKIKEQSQLVSLMLENVHVVTVHQCTCNESLQ